MKKKPKLSPWPKVGDIITVDGKRMRVTKRKDNVRTFVIKIEAITP